MLIELAVGDAYGACFECVKGMEHIEENNNLEYVLHPRNRGVKGNYDPVPMARYTDDTQMSIASVEMMMDNPRFFVREKQSWEEDEPFMKKHLERMFSKEVNLLFADKFVEVFKRNKRKGYTVYLLNVLMNSEDGKGLISRIHGNSSKSGGFMRAAPFGFYENLSDVIRAADLQARVTHDSWIGRNSAIGAAMMTHYFWHRLGPKHELCGWMRDEHFADTLHSPHPFEANGEWVECWRPGRRVGVHGWDCLEAAIYAIESHDDMAGILKECVSYGGDVDTVAAVAMAAASCSEEIEQNLPSLLVQNLENNAYGRDWLIDLDNRFKAMYPRKTHANSDDMDVAGESSDGE